MLTQAAYPSRRVRRDLAAAGFVDPTRTSDSDIVKCNVMT